MNDPTLWEHGLALLCGLVFPLAAAGQHLRARAGPEPEPLTSGEKVATYWSNAAILGLLAGAVVWAWLGAGRTLAELGLTAAPVRVGTGAAVAALALALYALDTWSKLATPARRAETRARSRRETPFLPATRRELAHSTVVVVAASVGEEVVFRGFLVAWVGSFAGPGPAGTAVAVGLPALAFAAPHVYQGVAGAARIAVGAVLVGAILVVTGSLWIGIALHFAVDLVGMLLGPSLLSAPDREE